MFYTTFFLLSVYDEDNNDFVDNKFGERHWFRLHAWLAFKKKEIIVIQRSPLEWVLWQV